MCVCVCWGWGGGVVCVSLASDSSETIEVIIIKLGMVTVSDMLMHHHVLIILNLIFIQGNADHNHENIKCLIISETIQATPITFAVEIVRLKVYMTVASPMTLTFIYGYKCVSNYFLACNISDNI